METPPFSNQENYLKSQKDTYKWHFLLTMSSAAGTSLFASTSPVAFIFFIMSLIWNYKQGYDSLKKMGIMNQFTSCERLNETLTETFGSRATVSSWLSNEKLLYEKDGLDCLVNLTSGLTFAISVRAILPPEKGTTRVFYHSNKKQLAYKKIKTGIRYFREDPIQHLQEKTIWLYQNRPELFDNSPIYILVIATPSKLEIKDDSPVQTLGAREYLYWNNTYIIEEGDIVTLIQNLERQQAHQPRKRVKLELT
jgi:hypothetical protein